MRVAQGLYVHVPFCLQRCIYCDFDSSLHASEMASLWLRAVAVELHNQLQVWPDFSPTTVFLGGGTPTALSEPELSQLVTTLKSCVDFSGIEEFTVEANPRTLSGDKLRLLQGLGVNRLSIGAQSFQPHLLSFLGRIHAADDVRIAWETARRVGFDNLSLDLLYGIPGQTTKALRKDLAEAFSLRLNHLSAYGLTVEPGTPLADKVARGEINLPEPEEIAKQYRLVRQLCAAAALPQYETSNYAQPGRECRHNLLYWRGGEYLGLGPSAASHVAGERRVNVRGVSEYVRRVLQTGSAAAERETLPPEKRAREALILELRLRRGVDPDEFSRRWGWDFRLGEAGESLRRHLDAGHMEWTSCGTIRLADAYLAVADAIICDFV
jgi:oxygen-independent coproporphyrinogen-3 oxidase